MMDTVQEHTGTGSMTEYPKRFESFCLFNCWDFASRYLVLVVDLIPHGPSLILNVCLRIVH